MLTREMAGRLLLLRSGLLGKRPYSGKEGILGFIRRMGCARTDAGPGLALTLLSHVDGITPRDLEELLYRERSLIEFYEKGTCVLPMEDYPYLSFVREQYSRFARSRPAVEEATSRALELLREKGTLSSFDELFAPAMQRVVTETLLYRGDMIVFCREEGRPVYAPAEKAISKEMLDAPSPFENDFSRRCWQVFQRARGAGLIWNANGEIWMGIEGLTAPERDRVFETLCRAEAVVPVRVEGITLPLYLPAEDAPLLRQCREPSGERTVRLLSPLDGLLWDRKLLSLLTGFSYRSEGDLVLPVLYGEKLAGRISLSFGEDCLTVEKTEWQGEEPGSRFWWDLEDEITRVCRYFGLERVCWPRER